MNNIVPSASSVSAAPSRIFSMGKEIKSRTTSEASRRGSGATLQSASRPVFLPAPARPAGCATLKSCDLSAREQELMETFGKLPFSWEVDWDVRIEPAA